MNTKESRWIVNGYLWHRRVAWVVLLLMLGWAISEVGYWFASAIHTPVAHTRTQPPLVGQPKGLSLQVLAHRQGIRALRNFRYVAMQGQLYFQLRDTYNRLQYYSVLTGKLLPEGDQQYAQYLARFFAGDSTSAAKATYVKHFSAAYPEDNRLLPVYRVAFDRADGLEVLVETGHSRLAAYHTSAERLLRGLAVLSPSFWLTRIASDTLRGWLSGVLLITVGGWALSGILLFGGRWQSLSQHNSYVRLVSLATAVAALLLVVSGVWQATPVPVSDERLRFVKNSVFAVEDLAVDTHQLPWASTRAENISVVSMPQGIFYQLFGQDVQGQAHTSYWGAATGKELKAGDFLYARYLANKFRAHQANIEAGVSFSCCLPPDTIPDGTDTARANIVDTRLVTAFGGEYGSTQRRLPVVKVSYGTPQHLTYYIETASSRQSLRMTDRERTQPYVRAKWSQPGEGSRPATGAWLAWAVLLVTMTGLFCHLHRSRREEVCCCHTCQ